jgi:NADH-quinone oxidoreductase subunit G
MGVRNNEILRIEPRENLNVNDYWLCDWGRLNTYTHVNDKEKRIRTPRIKIQEDNEDTDSLVEVDWEEAISIAASKLINREKDILFIASPFSTLEDNYVFKKFANEVFKSSNVFYNPFIEEDFGDDFLRKSDKTPNSNGLRLLGINPLTKECIEDLKNNIYKIVYVINDNPIRVKEFESLFRNVELSIQHLNIKSGFYNHASVVFPEATYAEVNGTFVNFQNRVQRIRPVIQVMEQERLIREFPLSRLDKFGEPNDRWTHGTKINAKPTWKILKQIAKILGHNFFFDNSEEVFIELCDSIPGMEGYNYDTVGEEGILVGVKTIVEAD